MAEILQGPEGRQVSYGAGKKIKCAFCKGTGIQPCSLKSHCFACRGKGEVEFEGPVIECPTCQGSGRVSHSSILSCIRCRGVGVVEKNEKAGLRLAEVASATQAGKGATDIIGERLGEITERLRWTRKEAEKKTKEIEKRLKPIKPFVKEVKKESLWLKKLGNKVKKMLGLNPKD